MSDEPREIKRWTSRRKAEVVMDIIKGKATNNDAKRQPE